MVCHSLLQWTTFCQIFPPWPDCLGWPHTEWLSFIELEKTVVLLSDWLVFCDYGFSVSALWCPLSAPTVLLGFLLPWMWGMSSLLLQQSIATADGDCSHEIKRCLLLGRKVMTNLDSILKSRDVTLPTKVHLVKATVFPVVMYGCESWTVKKAEC